MMRASLGGTRIANTGFEAVGLSRTSYCPACTAKRAHSVISWKSQETCDVVRADECGSVRAGSEIRDAIGGLSDHVSCCPSLLPPEASLLIQGRLKAATVILVLSSIWLCTRAAPARAVGSGWRVKVKWRTRPRRHLRTKRSKVCF